MKCELTLCAIIAIIITGGVLFLNLPLNYEETLWVIALAVLTIFGLSFLMNKIQ